ncbi:hypothetical protein N6L24_10585 [Cognatishimia sp. SS12]|uniref:hypothetical protein n=1 Tax=Cognatishimia sp. SS12 TaxID=2979465 RepID=UPI00232FC678|nr:hypothetical protein [Cognatishimia sp. SS12]MDC0738727.1 hypothetical protein [Cognatishimia sp. SS12]
MRTLLTGIWAKRRALLLYVALLLMGWVIGEALHGLAVPEMRPMNEPLIHRLVMVALAVFILAAAIPFVPGAEIGFALLFIFGGQAALLVFLGMTGAMLLSYIVARLVPAAAMGHFANWLGLTRTAKLLATQSVNGDAVIQQLSQMVDGRLAKFALNNRYLLLMLLLNTPGNSLLGGGGGLAFFAGSSGLYRFVPFMISVMIAVAPVPLAFALMDGGG